MNAVSLKVCGDVQLIKPANCTCAHKTQDTLRKCAYYIALLNKTSMTRQITISIYIKDSLPNIALPCPSYKKNCHKTLKCDNPVLLYTLANKFVDPTAMSRQMREVSDF